ncbi:hypothetical protein K2173_015755 [Erythroxylum novogranatense]|uniref:CCHC-type domain-containing protein n=1 Tax=Erythroxylum novogranatense TaxID=1862640 RepID=A0AAV8SF02_9ROSI|nr:hypothetical protein K2173_015755 [Erythroxylum novogranatense]
MKEAVVVSPIVSFRDKLLGKGSTHSAAIPLEEEDEISIGEEDYIATVENGVPSITFSDRIHGLLDKRMELCLIIKLLGRRITYNDLSNKLEGLWRTKRPFHLSTLENDYYMEKFQSKEDYVMVLPEGPWLVFGHCLTVQPCFNINQTPGLPSRMYVHDALTTIDKQVGKVIRVDSISEVATKTRFARIALYVDLQKALPSKIKINGRFQRIEYESLPFLCFKCSKYGHFKDNCPRNNPGNNNKGDDTGAKFKGSRFDLLVGQEENELAMDNLGKDAAPNDSSPMATCINNIRKEQIGSTSNRQGRKNANEPVSEAQKQANTVGSIRKGPTVTNFKKVADGVAQITNAKQPNLVGMVSDPKMPMELEAPVHDNPYRREHNMNLVALLETRISGKDADSVVAKLGYPYSHWVEANGFAGGIWLLWDDYITVDIIFDHSQFIHARVKQVNASYFFFITFVYGSPQIQGCKKLWENLSLMAELVQGPWMLTGDFNSILFTDERKGGAIRNPRGCRMFQEFMFETGLQDIGFNGLQCTWCLGSLFQRLDKAVVNGDWGISFPNTSVTHLEHLKSDHRPLLISFGGPQYRHRDCPFCFFSGWLEHESFVGLVMDKWDDKLLIAYTVYQFTEVVKAWNKAVGVQKALERRSNPRLVQLEIDLQAELEEILDNEEILWRQKSRCEWLADGDRNTKYYHSRTMARRRRNKISALRLQDNSWCYDDAMLKQEAIDFFSNLYTVEGQPPGPFPDKGYFPSISRLNFESLQRKVTEDEIKSALMDMYPLKASGVDGINA